MSKKMANFARKKSSLKRTCYLPTYLHTYQSSRLALYPKLTTFRSGIGPPMFLLYCWMPKKKKDFKFIREFPKEKTLSHNSPFSYRTCLNPFSFCLFSFFLNLGNFTQEVGPKELLGTFLVSSVYPKFRSSLCNLVEEGALKKHLVNSPHQGKLQAHIFSHATCLTKLLENYILVFHMFVGKKWQFDKINWSFELNGAIFLFLFFS